MKTLAIIAHPNLGQSNINRAWKEALATNENVTVHDLYETYPNFKIDVAREQKLLDEHDRVLFVFPFYWYSSPSLLKEWQDAVLTFGYAYGPGGTKLNGKAFRLVVSTGGPAEAYQTNGYNHFTMEELFRPFEAMSNLTGMRFETPYLLQGAMSRTAEDIAASADALLASIAENVSTN